MKKKLTMCGRLMVAITFLIINIEGLHAQWNTNTAVNIEVSGLTVADMQTATTSDGKIWVAFYHQNGSAYEMWAQLLNTDGTKLLGPDGILVSAQPSGTSTSVYNICVDNLNNVIIAFQDKRSGSNQAVVYKMSQAGVQLWGIDGIVLGAGLSPYPGVLSNGDVAIAWNETASSTLKIQKITNAGAVVWGTPVSVMVGTTKTTRGQVIANTNGKFTLVYQKKGVGVSTTLYAQHYDNDGVELYAPLQISNLTSSASRYYSIAAEADTTYFGLYVAQGSRFNSFLQRINPDGTIPWGMNGSNFSTSVASTDYSQSVTSIAMSPSSPYIWSVCTFMNSAQTQNGVYVQKFLRTTGARQFTDQGKVVYPVTASRDQLAGNVVLVNDNPIFMMYDVNYKIYATRLDNAGDFVWPGNRVEISSTTAVLALPKGRFNFSAAGSTRNAGFWYEDRGTGVRYGYAQAVSSEGVIGIEVSTQNGVPPTISIPGGTLQLTDTVIPGTANQNVTWSIIPPTGMASVSTSGLVTAQGEGMVMAQATSNQDNTVYDTIWITISGQALICNYPTTVLASQITSSTALISWPEAAPIPWEGYEYEIRTSGLPGSGPIGLVTWGSPPNGLIYEVIAGLAPSTQYYAYVRSNCGDGFFSEWTNGTSFVTLPEVLYLTGVVNEGNTVCYDATNTIQVGGNETSFEVNSGGSVTLIAGQTILFLPDSKVNYGGYLHGYITIDNEYCILPLNPVVQNPEIAGTVKSASTDVINSQSFRIYPNPATYSFTLELNKDVTAETVVVDVFSIGGMKMVSTSITGERTHLFNLAGFAPGVYYIRVTSGGQSSTMKIVKL